jgi:hypothetical protein
VGGPAAGPGDNEDFNVVRYMSKQSLDILVEAKVEAAMAEYFGALDVPHIMESIKKHDKILLGNGRPGLIEEMAVTKPMVAKLEAHLKNFSEFELQTKLDRQSFFGRFDAIENKVDEGFAEFKKLIEPLTGLFDKLTKGAVIIGAVGFVIGGIIMFLFEKSDKISEVFKWLTK